MTVSHRSSGSSPSFPRKCAAELDLVDLFLSLAKGRASHTHMHTQAWVRLVQEFYEGLVKKSSAIPTWMQYLIPAGGPSCWRVSGLGAPWRWRSRGRGTCAAPRTILGPAFPLLLLSASSHLLFLLLILLLLLVLRLLLLGYVHRLHVNLLGLQASRGVSRCNEAYLLSVCKFNTTGCKKSCTSGPPNFAFLFNKYNSWSLH